MPGESTKRVNINRKRAVFYLIPKICGYSSNEDFARPTLGISGAAFSQKATDRRERFSQSQLACLIEALRPHAATITQEAFSHEVYDFLDLFKEHKHFEDLEAWAARLFHETRDGRNDHIPPKPDWPASGSAVKGDRPRDKLKPEPDPPDAAPLDMERDSGAKTHDAMLKYYGTFFGFYLCLSEVSNEQPAIAVDAYRIEKHPEKRDGIHALITQLTDIDTEKSEPMPGLLRDRDGTIEIDLSQSLPEDPNSFLMGSCPPQDKIQSMLLINLDTTRGRRNTFARPTLFVRQDEVPIPKKSMQAGAATPLYIAVNQIIQTCMEFDHQRFMIAPKDRLERLSESDERQMRKLIQEFVAEIPADQVIAIRRPISSALRPTPLTDGAIIPTT
jgi:hypothetical protein